MMRGTAVLVALLVSSSVAFAADDPLAKQAQAAMEKATAFFRSISTNGGYLWRYSEDLKDREGEGKATETQIWVQPPGTPAVGMAFVRAYEVTKDKRYLEAAKAAAEALAWGQLESGGWDYLVDFDPEKSQRWYRLADKGKVSVEDAAKRRNTTTFDDNNTQAALRCLMAVVDASKDDKAQAALDYGLQGMLRAQYPNGAFPQRYDGKPRNPDDYPVKRATMPKDWPREYPKKAYGGFYTFNDNTMRDCVLTLLDAWKRYGQREHLDAAKKCGDFMILAQLPEPQPTWAQQYNLNMEPAWARKFEPPSACGNESVGVVRTLIDLHLETGEDKYLKPVPSALEWFKRSEIKPNTWARFYELETNKPLYFTKDYKLVYTDNDLPTHYSFQSNYGIGKVVAYYENVKGEGREAYLEKRKPKPLTAEEKAARRKMLEPKVREVVAALDAQGRWVNKGWIECQAFITNLKVLCDYLDVAASP